MKQMMRLPELWSKSLLAPLVAVAMIGGFYIMSREPSLPPDAATRIAARFSFERRDLPKISSKQPQTIREVHPSLAKIAGWMSFVGAAVSLYDLDNDGLANDMLLVDARYNEITVCPVPGTGERYSPFLLECRGLEYDEKTTAPMGTLVGDFNQDGLPDVLAYFWGRSPVVFFQEAADALSLSAFRASDLVTPPEIWHSNGAAQADLDGDGRFDLIIGNYNPDGARTLDPDDDGRELMMASWARATNGGRTRILLGTDGRGAESSTWFAEQENALDEEIACGWTFALGATDLDGDLLPEIYLVHDFGADCLLHNRSTPGQLDLRPVRGRRTLMTSRSKVIGQDTFNGMGVDFADLNGDQRMDIMVSNITSDFGLHQSNLVFVSERADDAEVFQELARGVAPFIDRSEELGLSRGGWTWEVRFGDFDNDGTVEVLQATGFTRGSVNRWPELHEMVLGNEELAGYSEIYPFVGDDADVAGREHNPFFVRHGEQYYDIAQQLASSKLDEPMLSRGIATADVDGDGRLDFALANNWQDSYFFHNQSQEENAFLGLNLRLPLDELAGGGSVVTAGHPSADTPSLPAFGAQVKVRVQDGTRETTMVRHVDGGTGHSGRSAPTVHFGLGDVDPDDAIEATVTWRDRRGEVRKQTFSELNPGWHTILLQADEPGNRSRQETARESRED